MTRVGIVGLGVMGSAMARNLLAAGHEVHGYDIVDEKVSALEEMGGHGDSSVAEVVDHSDVVLLSLPSVEALQEVTGQLTSHPKPDTVVVEMGTLPLEAKYEARDRLAEVGMTLLDVPVSGTGLQAADATLVVFASGPEDAFRKAEPIFAAIGRSTHYLGEFGLGSVMKYIANLLVTIHNLSTAEAHALGIAAGIDPEVVQRVMSDGVGSSKIFDIRGPMMVRDVYEPPAARLDIILKDAKIIRDFAKSVGAPTPLLEAAIPVYEQSSAEGLGALDAAALCRFLERRAGLRRPTKRE
ncbi:MAG: 2-hydroxy-3-oxopropionate reductase [Acidimicrobiia bacterium]|nr:MAG: 2-hydroxy-3-oxopropionate reductase [Acidimicrobiia bacterium]